MSLRPIVSFEGQYAFLSNFWPCMVKFEGDRYPSAEHAFQAAKTTNRIDRRMIRSARTAGVAKRMGQRLELRSDWEEVKIDVMRQILHEKFARRDLGIDLLETDDRTLVEGNTWGDIFWGACYGSTLSMSRLIGHLPRWETGGMGGDLYGHNHLGVLLMEIREELK